MSSKVPSLKIGSLEAKVPVIQGGMGVRVSGAGLAGAVAREGAIGIIAGVGLAPVDNLDRTSFISESSRALRDEIKKAREIANGGIIGVNLMVALSNYKELAEVAVEEKVDLIISGAGLPLELPAIAKGSNIPLIPIVSSLRTFNIVMRKWLKQDTVPAAVIIEGPKAGGHLGYAANDLDDPDNSFRDNIIKEIVNDIKERGLDIPVISAGGVFTGKDIADALKSGCSGVQMGTRFVCTEECDVHEKFKQAYLKAKSAEDTAIIKSPVGLPGRVIKSPFVEKIQAGETVPFKCAYKCLKTCIPYKAPYCIAKVLTSAADGNLDEAFVFAGENAWRCDKILSVHDLVEELLNEAEDNL